MAQCAALAEADRDPAKRGGACRILFCRSVVAECGHGLFLSSVAHRATHRGFGGRRSADIAARRHLLRFAVAALLRGQTSLRRISFRILFT